MGSAETGLKITIRPAGSADMGALLYLMERLYAEDGTVPFRRASHLSATEGLLDSPDLGQIYIVGWRGSIVGYAVLTWAYSLEYGGTQAMLDEMYITPDHRRKGLARRALVALESVCRDRGARALHLEVERSNDAAQALYRSIGFDSHDRLLLTKRLDS